MSCKICEQAEATKHNHFGANGVCASCRAFFMRSVQNNLYDNFKCSSDKSTICVIESKARKSCKKCRFEKCLAVGMKIKFVLDKAERCKRIMVKNKATPKVLERLSFSENDQAYSEDLFNVFKEFTYKQTARVYADDVGTMQFFMDQCHKGRVMGYDETKYYENNGNYITYTCMADFLKFLGLQNTNDVNALVRNNWHKLVVVYTSLGLFSSQESIQQWRDEFFDYGPKHKGEDEHIDKLTTSMEQLGLNNIDPKECKGCVSYSNMYSSPWSPDYYDEQRHKDILKEIQAWLCNGESGGHGDLILISLLSMMMAFNTDGISEQLKYKDQIEAMQVHFTNLLWKYIKSKHADNAGGVFHKSLTFFSTTEEAYEISQRRLPI